MNNKYNVERFIDAQNSDYNLALKEITNGHKENHWIWYIFPQVKGLGYSYESNYYGIENLDEAKQYLKNPILKQRLIEINNCLYNLKINDPIEVFGYIDSLKVHASLTLFSLVSDDEIFNKNIDKYFHGELHKETIKLLKKEGK